MGIGSREDHPFLLSWELVPEKTTFLLSQKLVPEKTTFFAVVEIGSDSISAFANYLFVWQEEALPKLASTKERGVSFILFFFFG